MAVIELSKITRDELITISLQELLAFQKLLREAVESRRNSDKQALLDKINALALQEGYSLDDLLNNKPKKVKKTVAVKYRDPNNPSNTWKGRGVKPLWLKEFLEKEGKLEDCEV